MVTHNLLAARDLQEARDATGAVAARLEVLLGR
jgi:hypothetical protein